MSYREIKNVTDVLRRMGYPRLVSLESFRNPNFMLLADILNWFLKHYDPAASSQSLKNLNTEVERVTFIRYFVQHILRKTGVKLNGRRLYQADGYAVKEISKLITFYTSATTAINQLDKENSGHAGHKDLLTQFYQLQPSLHKVKVTRDLSAFLTEKGVSFFDLITKELSNGSGRETVLAKTFDVRDYDHLLTKAISAVKAEEAKLRTTIDSALHSHTSLDLKIQKKRQELERSEQRLETMAKVRPAYMDDFEKVQRELEGLYHQYVAKFRILSHLQHQMEEMGTHQQSHRTKGTKAVLRNDLHPNLSPPLDDMSGSEPEDDSESLEASLDRKGEVLRSEVRVKKPLGNGAEIGLAMRGKSGRKGLLNMYGTLEDDEESESESDLLMLEGDNSDIGSEIDEDTDLLVSMRNNSYPRGADTSTAIRLRESAKIHRPTPPGPTGSRNNLDEELNESQLDYSHILRRPHLNGSTNGVEVDPNGDLGGGGGDSLTKPLRPDPRYSSNGRLGREMSPPNAGRQSGRPSTKKRGNRSGNGPLALSDRPTTRPASHVTQLLHELNEKDLD